MARIGKRYKALSSKRDDREFYKLDDALALIKETGSTKFDETVDVAINLGVMQKNQIRMFVAQQFYPGAQERQ